jgi:3-oxoacyl-[acyl-carrier protein] reductase
VTNFIRLVVPHMPLRGGSIVNITSIEAHRGAPGFAVYAAMKAAVENLTRSLALEFANRLIRVNAVAPDAVPTGGEVHLRAAAGETAQPRTPLLVPGEPDHVAGAVLFLASDLSAFVTGTTIHVDGGNNAARGWRCDSSGTWSP